MAQPGPISAEDIRRVSSARWIMPILAMMSVEHGSRFGSLARTLGMSRSVLSRHLDVLEGFGWIARNPGHGHPLRPEYMLTLAGCAIAAWCGRVMAQRSQLGLERGELGRWSLPVIFELRAASRRFSELERGLAPVTPRALSLTLKQMFDTQLVSRELERRRVQIYGLTNRGQDLAATLITAG